VPLRVFQSLWAMGALPYRAETEWTVPEQVEKIIEGGFEGIDIGWTPILPCQEALDSARAAGLDYGITCFPKGEGDGFEELVAMFASLDPVPLYLNIQPDLKVFTVEEGAAELRRCLQIAQGAGFQTVIETHRDRMTTDLRFTLQLMDAVPELRMNADLSHFVVGQEFAWPVGQGDHELMHRVVERADMFHGRVASREQVQIPISWDYHRPWLDLFSGWWEHGFRHWRERSAPGDDLCFITELGPPMWYAMTGPDGKEMSDRWHEALMLKDHVQGLWDRLETSTAVA
jgi:hypothetical protein